MDINKVIAFTIIIVFFNIIAQYVGYGPILIGFIGYVFVSL
jgi:hypothetical protein